MRIIKLFLGVYLLFALSACQNKAIDFNNKVAEILTAVMPKVQALANKISTNTDTTNEGAAKLGTEAKGLVKELQDKLSELKTLDVPAGGEEFRDAVVGQFNYQINYCSNYSKFVDSTSSDEVKQAALSAILRQAQTADSVLESMLNAQKKFAQKYKLQILPEKKEN